MNMNMTVTIVTAFSRMLSQFTGRNEKKMMKV